MPAISLDFDRTSFGIQSIFTHKKKLNTQNAILNVTFIHWYCSRNINNQSFESLKIGTVILTDLPDDFPFAHTIPLERGVTHLALSSHFVMVQGCIQMFEKDFLVTSLWTFITSPRLKL